MCYREVTNLRLASSHSPPDGCGSGGVASSLLQGVGVESMDVTSDQHLVSRVSRLDSGNANNVNRLTVVAIDSQRCPWEPGQSRSHVSVSYRD